jgi:hypothetical protein
VRPQIKNDAICQEYKDGVIYMVGVTGSAAAIYTSRTGPEITLRKTACYPSTRLIKMLHSLISLITMMSISSGGLRYGNYDHS